MVSKYSACKCKSRKIESKIVYDKNIFFIGIFDLYSTAYNKLIINVLFQLSLEKKVCHLSIEFQTLDVWPRLLRLHSRRVQLLTIFQRLVDHDPNILKVIVNKFEQEEMNLAIKYSLGMKIGVFFNEGGWYSEAANIYTVCEICLEQPLEDSAVYLKKLLDIYHR